MLAQSEDGGQAGAFLRNGVSSRALSMGGAFTALADDPSAGYWNPAGLGLLQFPELIGTYSILSLDRKYNYFSFAMPVKNYGSIGISWINLGVGGIEGRDILGSITNTLSNSESAYYFSYGYQLESELSVGFSFKYLQHTLAGFQSTGYGMDFGLLYTLSPQLRLGATVQDISSNINWNTPNKTQEKFPRTIKAGLCYSPFKNNTRFTLDYAIIQNMGGHVMAGMEMELFSNIGVRAGYDGNRFVGGGYFYAPINSFVFEVDYSIGKDIIDMSYAHKVSVRFKFSNDRPITRARKPVLHRRINGQLELLSSDFDARIVKVSGEHPSYALINLGLGSGTSIGKKYQVYRNISSAGKDGTIVIHVGVVEVVKIETKMSAIRIVSFSNAYLLKIGDFLFEEKIDL
ncbi:PorV/PorQ family protein [bacterium]|nr:PorV/PorQ family protein [bacterium]